MKTSKNETKNKEGIAALRSRIFILSWLGAVLFPCIRLHHISCLCSIGYEHRNSVSDSTSPARVLYVQNFMAVSASILALGFLVLLVVVATIDSAARKIPIPEFEVYFKGLSKTLKCKRKQMSVITLCIKNKGEDLAEDALIMVHFPPSFQVQSTEYRTYEQGPETDHSGYHSAIFDIDRMYPDTISKY